MTDIKTTVANIPAVIRVHSFIKVRGSHSYNAPSDMDYHGYTESEWEVCDRRGRPAPWLARKINAEITGRIEETISAYMKGE
jgi:hypothetical protein